MSEKKNVPELRFVGYTDTWEQRKLSELATVKDSARIPNSRWAKKGIPYIRASDLSNNDLSGNLFLSEDTYQYYKNQTGAPACGDVLFNGGGEIGKAVINRSENPIYVQGGAVLYVQTASSKMLDGEYLEAYFNTPFALKNIEILSAGGTMKHFTLGPAQSLPICFPAKTEQSMIGKSITQLDTLITLQQRKCERLKNIKKAMLEKMFPREGYDVPEIRFEGFSGAWERKKLSQIANIIGGGTPDTNNPDYWDGNIDWYAPAEIGENSYAEGSVRKITELGLQKSSATILPAGRTILFTSRAGIGKTAILRHSGATNQGFQSLVLMDGYSPYFIYSMSESIKKKAEAVAAGSTFLEISGKMLGNLDVMVPAKTEQDRIAAYFESLDHLITLHQQKHEKLKQLKQSLLEKMFV